MGYKMKQTRKKMRFEILIDRLFSNFHRVILTNLIFFVPLVAVLALYYLFMKLISGFWLTLSGAGLITLLFPFYSGVVLVCRNIARGDEDVPVFSTYFKGVKENFFRFLLYGFLLSLVTIVCYYSINFYSALLSSSWIFYGALFVCILIALALLFTAFYIPVMTVTFDLKLKPTFKNSFLMSFGEIKNNVCALIAMVIVIAISFTFVAFFTEVWLVVAITLALLALIVPACCQFVVSFYVYDDMYDSIADRSTKAKSIDDAIVDAKNKKNNANQTVKEQEDYSDVDISTLKDTDDYIFYKGKMIKQSELIRRVLEQRENNENSADKKEV